MHGKVHLRQFHESWFGVRTPHDNGYGTALSSHTVDLDEKFSRAAERIETTRASSDRTNHLRNQPSGRSRGDKLVRQVVAELVERVLEDGEEIRRLRGHAVKEVDHATQGAQSRRWRVDQPLGNPSRLEQASVCEYAGELIISLGRLVE